MATAINIVTLKEPTGYRRGLCVTINANAEQNANSYRRHWAAMSAMGTPIITPRDEYPFCSLVFSSKLAGCAIGDLLANWRVINSNFSITLTMALVAYAVSSTAYLIACCSIRRDKLRRCVADRACTTSPVHLSSCDTPTHFLITLTTATCTTWG